MPYQLIVYTTSEAGKHRQMQMQKENTSKRRCDHTPNLITRFDEIPSGNRHIDLIDALLFWNRLAFLWLW